MIVPRFSHLNNVLLVVLSFSFAFLTEAAAQNYEIMAIPSLLVFKKGEVIERIVGVQPQPQLEAKLQEILEPRS